MLAVYRFSSIWYDGRLMDKDDRKAITKTIEARHLLLKAVRGFFYDRGYLEVETPYLMRTAPPDPYIDPLNVFVGSAGPCYLHTSPEVGMKKLLAAGCERIFEICKAFRVEEFAEHHAIEFTMAEWYSRGTYREAMEETQALITWAAKAVCGEVDGYFKVPWEVYRVKDLFLQMTGIDPFPLTRDELRARMERHGFRGLKNEDTWEDLFFKLFIQEVEPHIQEKGPYFMTDWPASLTAMAQKKDGHTVERFELYLKGLEIANGYTELLNPEEQRERLLRDNAVRANEGKARVPLGRAVPGRAFGHTRPGGWCFAGDGQASYGASW